MQLLDGRLVHSASDLNAFTECLHLVELERAVAAGSIARPVRHDATADLLARKGDEHERRQLAALRAIHGGEVVAFEHRPVDSRAGYEAAERATVAAMESGARVIYQATFFDGTFLGRADFLQRIDAPSGRWPWSYHVVETKLALSAKPYFLIQLCNYTEHVARIQASDPAFASIVLGTGRESRFRMADYAAYYRRLKAAYVADVEQPAHIYPIECPHCDVCAWSAKCAARRDADDHLSLVAGIRRDQIAKLDAAGIDSLHALAIAPGDARPARLNPQTFAGLCGQAAEQHRFRALLAATGTAQHSYTFRPTNDDRRGFARLPEPNTGDIFFDMEGDPMYRPDRALEYLFGVYVPAEETYVPFWGTSPADERIAFEAFVDFVVARAQIYPDLHIYHYAPYEVTALKRLMGRFGSREAEIDGLLRRQTFVDLYPVVTQSLWVSQPSYSIKKLEALYGFVRETRTRGGDESIVMFEGWLDTQDPATLEDIRAYNEDDCRSTFLLREWLVRLRGERNARLETPTPWRAPIETPAEPLDTVERGELELALLAGLPEPESPAVLAGWSDSRRARWLLGNLIDFHRREQKPQWWEHFHRLENPSELIDEDRKALGGLRLRSDPPYKTSPRGNLHYAYDFPPQEYDIGTRPLDGTSGKSAGKIASIDDTSGRLTIALAAAIRPESLRALLPGHPIGTAKKREAIEVIAGAYLAGTLATDYPATSTLLLGEIPRLSDRPRGSCLQPDIVSKEAVSRVVQALDASHLVVQGPPGTGKSTIGAHVIVDLLAAGKRVALAAQSHKALHTLARKVEQTALARGVMFRGCHKSSTANPDSVYVSAAGESPIEDASTHAHFAGCALVSATTFGWAEASQRGAFDVVVIDEAGQISLADALATSLVARNVVLLGDPQQLPQVSQGFHPVGADPSILEHILGAHATIPVERGIFLDTSYRMQPDIDRFVSRAFYESRLRADALNANNCISIDGRSEGGVRYLEVVHAGNSRRSVEEADCIVSEVAALLAGGTVSIRDLPARRIEPADILIVTPYNVQRVAIGQRLERRGLGGVAVGTVDKYQGQEAPIVLYSMTTSSADLAPRGLDFLLSPNRLNVAISRAQALSIVVCSPQLLASRAISLDGMRLLSLLCAYVEAATRHSPFATREQTPELQAAST